MFFGNDNLTPWLPMRCFEAAFCDLAMFFPLMIPRLRPLSYPTQKIKYIQAFFTIAPKLVGPWSSGYPNRGYWSSHWTDKNKHVCKVWNWSRVVDCLMIVSWLSHYCLMTQKELFRIRWAIGLCHVGPCFI